MSGTVEQKLQIYAELTPEGRAAAARDVVRKCYEKAEAPLEPWVQAQPSGAARQGAIQELVMYQAYNAPERIDALVDAWPAGPDRDTALRGVVSSLSENDPRRGSRFARRVSGTAARESAFEDIAQN